LSVLAHNQRSVQGLQQPRDRGEDAELAKGFNGSQETANEFVIYTTEAETIRKRTSARFMTSYN